MSAIQTEILKRHNDIKNIDKLKHDWSNISLAYPNLITIRLDPEMAYLDDVNVVFYAYFPGDQDDICSQIVISHNEQLVKSAKRDESITSVPEKPDRLRPSVNQAMYRSIAEHGDSQKSARAVLDFMMPFGIGYRKSNDWARPERILTLDPLSERVASILHRVLMREVFKKDDPRTISVFSA